MSKPTSIQFQVLESRLERIDFGHPITASQEPDGGVRVNAAGSYFLRSEDEMDSFLSDMDDLDYDLEPDQIFDSMVHLLDGQCN